MMLNVSLLLELKGPVMGHKMKKLGLEWFGGTPEDKSGLALGYFGALILCLITYLMATYQITRNQVLALGVILVWVKFRISKGLNS